MSEFVSTILVTVIVVTAHSSWRIRKMMEARQSVDPAAR